MLLGTPLHCAMLAAACKVVPRLPGSPCPTSALQHEVGARLQGPIQPSQVLLLLLVAPLVVAEAVAAAASVLYHNTLQHRETCMSAEGHAYDDDAAWQCCRHSPQPRHTASDACTLMVRKSSQSLLRI